MNNTQTLSLTVGINYAETAKNIMAELAIIAAGRPEEKTLPLANCRIRELAAAKSGEACNSLCAMLSGYVTESRHEAGTFTIELRLPCHITPSVQRTLAARIDEAVTLTVMTKLLSGSQWLADELHECRSRLDKTVSSLRQLLAPH